MKDIILELREFMKGYTELDENVMSDQKAELPQPSMFCDGKQLALEGLDVNDAGKLISLTKDFSSLNINNDFLSLLNSRVSRRQYSDTPISLDELSFLLWATQGVKSVIGKKNKASLRTVPSAGARHPLETYLFINLVEGLSSGIYHYIASDHKLEYLGCLANMKDRLAEAYCGQTFFGNAPVVFVWTAIPYRSEWRYTTKAQKYTLLDAGHVCQNLYLACEAIGCGTCAIGAYEQPLADALLGLSTEPDSSNENEFVIYAASVGKCPAEQ